ncbi:MAG: hypothetical protein PGN26_14360 [Xylophilus ampelinus]
MAEGPASSEEVADLLRSLIREVSNLSQQLSPWVGVAEMEKRYGVTLKTLTAMERRGDLPLRHKGRWSRVELIEWETRSMSK